jgi:hypothetical protein
MYIDALTIAGFACAASFTLMPLLMGREFWRVAECEQPASHRDQLQSGLAADRGELASGCF